PYTDVRTALIELLDVDHIDVFRGPQLIRFGRSAEAGAIPIVTRTPGTQVGAQGSVEYGDFDTQIYHPAAGGPPGPPPRHQPPRPAPGFKARRVRVEAGRLHRDRLPPRAARRPQRVRWPREAPRVPDARSRDRPHGRGAPRGRRR